MKDSQKLQSPSPNRMQIMNNNNNNNHSNGENNILSGLGFQQQ